MDSPSNLDLVLIGKSGNGKSSTGNSILRRRQIFKSSYNTTSITKYPQYEVTRFEGRAIQVVDCPGVLDTDVDSTGGVDLVVSAIQNAVLANPQGYHAFLIVVKFAQRFTEEELRCMEILKGILGKDVIKTHGIIVMCNGDTFAYHAKNDGLTLENFCKEQRGAFKNLLDECKNRIVVFDNMTEDEDIKNKQLKCLIQTVDQLKSNGNRYTTDYFRKALSLTESLQDNKRLFIIQNIILNEMRNILQNNNSCDKEKLTSLHELTESSKKLYEEINKKDNIEIEFKQNVGVTHKFISTLLKSISLEACDLESQTGKDTSNKLQSAGDGREITSSSKNVTESKEQYINKTQDLSVRESTFSQTVSNTQANGKTSQKLSEMPNAPAGIVTPYSKSSRKFNESSYEENARSEEHPTENKCAMINDCMYQEFIKIEEQFKKIQREANIGFFKKCLKIINKCMHNLYNYSR